MEMEASLLLFYVDYLPEGRSVEDLVEDLYAWKALHVQELSPLTKQRSAAYTILAEVRADDEGRLARNLAVAYGIARYHRMASELRYQPVTRAERPIVAVHHEQQLGLTVAFSLIGTEQEPLHVRVAEQAVEDLHGRLTRTFGLSVALPELRKRLETLLMREDGFVLELHEA